MRYDRVVSGGNIVTPAGSFSGDVGIVGEKIVALGLSLDTTGADVIDAAGHHVIPGVLDVHVHLALPFCGTTSADDYRTGTRAGARGGVTTLIDFAIPYAGESLSQAADNWMRLPLDITAMYCSPSTSKVAAGELTPAPVWNLKSSLPFAMSRATKLPSGSPCRRRPPAVLSSPAPVPIGHFVCFCQTILLVVGSMAVNVPERGAPAGR